jgi:hypothetical protein
LKLICVCLPQPRTVGVLFWWEVGFEDRIEHPSLLLSCTLCVRDNRNDLTTAARSDASPDIPTVGEFMPGYEASYWSGIGAPKDTPAEIIDKLNREINAAFADPNLRFVTVAPAVRDQPPRGSAP